MKFTTIFISLILNTYVVNSVFNPIILERYKEIIKSNKDIIKSNKEKYIIQKNDSIIEYLINKIPRIANFDEYSIDKIILLII
jgi:hypothetical protein